VRAPATTGQEILRKLAVLVTFWVINLTGVRTANRNQVVWKDIWEQKVQDTSRSLMHHSALLPNCCLSGVYLQPARTCPAEGKYSSPSLVSRWPAEDQVDNIP